MISGLVMGTISAYFATRRGRNPYAWFAICAFAGILGLCLLFFLSRINPVKQQVAPQPLNKAVVASSTILSNNQTWFYLNALHEQQGPVPFDQLKASWKQGQIAPQTFVWCDGMDNWLKIIEVSHLHTALNS